MSRPYEYCYSEPMTSSNPKKRPAMIASVVREIIAPALRGCPPACGIVTITRVEVSQDASYATVYISALKEPKLALASLEERLREIQHQVGKKLQIRLTPRVRFRLDESGERGAKIEQLIDRQLQE